ncbi:hypothetical protein MRS76_25710 [Rhizobiaceae bacterium n13]|nr:hypothetical protein [Fererhizobium litorale]MDI7865295.1 hypothetical protein [Fererhizobium litorale]
MRQNADRDARSDGGSNASDTFAGADSLKAYSRFLQQIETAFPQPTRAVKQRYWQRATVFKLVKDRHRPYGGFMVNDNVISRDMY